MRKWVVSAGFLLAALWCGVGLAADEPREWSVSMSVEAKNGESKSSDKSLGTKRGGSWRNRTTQRTTQKTTIRNKKWVAHVSCTGKNPPAEAKIKVFYIGYRGKTLAVLGEREYPVALTLGKRTDVELTSPDAKMVKTTTTRRSRRSGGSAKSRTTGDRMVGCVAQLSVNGKIEKTYSTQSGWTEGLHNEPFTEGRLDKKKL